VPYLVKITESDDVDKYIPPTGYAVLFLAKSSSGSVEIKAKLEDGTIVSVGGSSVSADAAITPDAGTVSVPELTQEEISEGTWSVSKVDSDYGLMEI
jgi:hypothetical protein